MPNLDLTGPPPRESRRVTFSRRAAVNGLGAVAVWPYISDHAAAAFAYIHATQAAPVLAFLTPAGFKRWTCLMTGSWITTKYSR